MENGLQLTERRCLICGKTFVPAPMHVYKVNNSTVCSWSCVCRHEREKEARRRKKKGDADGCS